jgi:hypothetical protein
MGKRTGIPNDELFRLQYTPTVLDAVGLFRNEITRARFPLHSAEAKAGDAILAAIDDLAQAITGVRTFFHGTGPSVTSNVRQLETPPRPSERFSVAGGGKVSPAHDRPRPAG